MVFILSLVLLFHAGASEDIDVTRAEVCISIAQEKCRLDHAQLIQITKKSVFDYDSTRGKIIADIAEECYKKISEDLV